MADQGTNAPVDPAGAPAPIDTLIREAAARHGVPPDPLLAIVQQESHGDPNAFNPASGARGIAQFIPDTARRYGIDPNDPAQSADAAARMFADNLKRFGGDTSKAIAAHFGGTDEAKWGPKTRKYVDEVSARMPSAAAPPYRGDDSGNRTPEPKLDPHGAPVPEEGWTTFMPTPVAAAPEDDGNVITDSAKLLAKGAANIGTTIGQGLTYAGRKTGFPGMQAAGETIRDLGQNAEAHWHEALSPSMRQALDNPLITEDFQLGDTPLKTIYANTLEMLPSLAAMGGAGGLTMKGFEAVGAATRVARLMEGMGAPAAAVEKATGYVTRGAAFGGSQALYMSLQAASSAEQQVKAQGAQDPSAFDGSEAYRQAYANTDPRLPDAQRRSAAAEELAQQVGDRVFTRSLALNGGVGMLTGGGIFNEWGRNLAKGGITRRAASAGVDAGILTPQMVGQQLVGNEAQQLANPDYPLMTGVPNAAAMGITTGAMFGAAMGGKPHEPARTLTPPRAEQEVSGKTERAPIAAQSEPVAAQSVPSEPIPAPAARAEPRPDMGEKPAEPAPTTEPPARPALNDAELNARAEPAPERTAPPGVDPETGEIRKPLAPGMLEGDIGRKDGTPFKNPFAAQNALRKLGLEETHSVAPIEGGGFAVRAKPPRTSLDESAHQAATSPENDHPEPTENEKKAGNYLKGHDRFAGMEVSFENPAGSVRKGVSRSGKPWENTMQDHYGYIRGTVGKDKDHIDAFWKPGTPKDFDGHVFVVDQRNAARGFDEHKVIFGASSREDAEATYRRNYTKNWKGMGALTEVPMDGFKAWLKNGDTKQPFAPQAEKFVHTPAVEANGYAKPVPGHATEREARAQAEVQSATTGKPHAVIPHPSLPGQFAVVPERRVASAPHTPERRAPASEKSEASSENSATPVRSAKQQARDEELRRIALGRKTVHPDKDSLIPAIIKLGGIRLSERKDTTGDTKGSNPRLPFVGSLFQQKGLGIDEMATALHERRYLSDADLADVDGGVQKVRDLIGRELGGEKHYSTHADMERVAAEKYGEQPHEEVTPADAQAEVPPEAEPARDAVADEAYAAAEGEVHNRDWGKMTQSERDAELDSIFGAQDHEVHTGNPDQARGPDASAAEAGAGGGPAAGEGAHGEGHPAGVSPAEGFSLAGHDRAELERRDAERVTADAAKAQAAAAAETRATADAERDQFTLAGSDRDADTAAARGQGDLLSTAARIEPAKPPAALEEAPKQQGPAPKIEDFGEKIGGARKDVAKPLGSRPKIEAEPDQRPAWARKYIPMPQVVRSLRGAEAGLERTGKWTLSIADKDGRARPVSRQTFDSEAEALAAIPLAEVSRNHRVVSINDGKGTQTYGIFRTIGDRKRALVKGGFETEDAAMRHLVQHAPDIIEHKFAFPERPWLDKIERVGEPKRQGDVSPKQFQEQFGFRAGEFGNWNMGGDGQAALNHAFDALHDLADTLGVPPKALSLDGKLAIAFGARGHGGKDSAAAHYERDRAVINLTKIKGAGSLAHEWFHALDHYLGGQAGKRGAEREDAYLTYGPHYKDNEARPELLAAFKGVVDAMTAKKHGVAVDENQAQRAYTRAQESVKRHLDDLRQSIARARQYGAKKGAASAEQLEKWDALAKRALTGDPGADVRVPPPKGASRMSLGYGSSEVVRGLNELYKAVTGRSFDRADETSEGRRLHWSIRSVRDMNERVAKAQAGTVEERKTGTEYLDEAKKIDSFRASNYWSTPHEMGARAFESYIFDKLAAGAKRSDYLTHAVENKYYALLGLKPYPEGAERATINTAFDHLFKAIQSKETDQGTALFSRAKPEEQRQVLAETFRALGEHHEFFQRPLTTRKTVKGIAHDMDPKMEVLPGTVPAGDYHAGDDAYTLYNTRNGTQGSLYVSHDGKVELDVSGLKHGEGGGAFYQIAATFAHNNGLKFIGDTRSFSLDAMYRRTEHLLSSALRHGTTDHIEPHPDQTGHLAESLGLRAIDWRPGEHDHNIAELLLTSLSTVERRLPEIQDLAYDFVRHEFTDRITGRPVDDAYFNELASSLDGRAARAGRNTIARAIVAQSVLREAGSRGRDDFLAEFRRLADQHLPGSLIGRAYSRAPTQARPGAGLSVSDIQSQADDIGKAWANGPRVHVVAAPADLPFHAPGDARGAFHNGQVYLVASNLPDAGAVQFALFHEAKGHYGLRGLLGEQLTPELTRLANVNQNVRKAAYDWRADNPQPKGMSDAEYRARSIEEALSDLAGSAKLSGVQRFVAAVQKGLRAIGLTKVADWLEGKTDAEALSLLGRASKYVEEGEHAPPHAEPAQALSRSEVGPSPEYTAALEKANAATAAFHEASQRYRAREIGDDEYLAARKVHDESGRAFDEAYAAEQKREPARAEKAQTEGERQQSLFSRQKASMAPGEEARDREPLPGLPKVTRDDFVRGAKDLFKSYSPLNWWDKTLATQRQKAEKSPLFKAVWDKARAIEKDTSQMAMEAAERAPGLLPLMKDWKDAFKGRVGSQKARDAAGRAIYEGTLHDQEVYSDAELKQRFEQWGVSDKDAAQATELYREALAANNRSLDDLHASIGARIARLLPGFDQDVIARAKADPTDARGAYDREFLRLADAMERMHQKTGVDHVQKIRRQVAEVFDQNEKLKREGYFPLMRFGKYAVYARDRGAEGVEGEENQGDTDKKPYFGLFENKVEAERMRRALTEHYDTVTSGEVSKEAWRSMEGLSPETVRMFASAVGMDESEAFKDWIRLALANHSAMKRLLPRKGIPGFDTDPQRTLAHFITSNARAAARNYHMDDMMAAEQAIPKSEGRIKDEAVKLTQYLRHPEADAAGLRSLMFTQYIGGSIASAMVNLTQPVLQTAPYLSRFGDATKYLAAAFRDGTGALAKEADVRAALARADREGVTSPHELYQLYNESIRGLGSSPAWVRFQKVWGGFFAVSEQFNRRITFSAAFRMARDGALEKINEERAAAGHTPFKDAYAFAEHAVEETQSVYSKANRPNWGRGAIGASLLTFKQFTIQYLEFLTRLPRAQQGVALALLVGGAGVQGLPFAQNLEDLIDTVGQGLGWNTNSHEWMRTKAASVLGKTAGDVLMRGVSAIPGSPIDVSQRIGLGNIIPGTGMFKPSEKDKLGQLLKWAGVPGSTAQTVLQAGGKAVSGDGKGAGTDLLPNAVKNAYAGFRMATTGQYDSPVTGKPIMKVSPQDALAKGIGFQPYDVAAYRQTEGDLRQDLGGVTAAKTRILDQWARAQAAGDTDGIKAARAALADWNKKNPDTPITINGGQLSARVRTLKTEAPERLIKAAPKQLRGMVRQSLADTHPTE
jgi:hypothetical protein